MSTRDQEPIKVGKTSAILLYIASFQKTHWVVSLFVVKLSALWFSLIVTYVGEPFHLITYGKNGKQLTTLGWIATIILFAIIILFEISKGHEQKLQQEPYELNGFYLLNKLRISIGSICDAKLKTLTNEIDTIKRGGTQVAPVIVSNPSNQLELIVQQAVSCLSSLLSEDTTRKAQSDDMYLTIAYQFPEESDSSWHWATEERGLGFDKLLVADSDGRRSTFDALITGGRNYEFFNRKADAFKQNIYKPDAWDERDQTNELMGSIACYKLEVKKNDKIYIRAILSITSYTHQFTSDNSREAVENVRHNMYDFVINDFSKRIKIELCLLYLKYLNSMCK